MATTGTLLRNARLDAHLSQGKLSKLLGCSISLISHWEADRKPIADLPAVAAALGVPVESVTGTNPAPLHPGRPLRSDNPPPEGLPEAVPGWHFINMSQLLRWIKETYGLQMNAGRIYELIHDKDLKPPFPANRNPLKKNPQGEPTLLFQTSKVGPWIDQMIQPIRTEE